MKRIKRLTKNIKKLRYRLIITNSNIELKLTSKRHNDKEMNWVIANEKETILNLCFQLEQMIDNGEF